MVHLLDCGAGLEWAAVDYPVACGRRGQWQHSTTHSDHDRTETTSDNTATWHECALIRIKQSRSWSSTLKSILFMEWNPLIRWHPLNQSTSKFIRDKMFHFTILNWSNDPYLYGEEVIADLREHVSTLEGRGQHSHEEAIVMSPCKRELTNEASHAPQTLHKVGSWLSNRILHTVVNTLREMMNK